jgi:hypothetical protein
VTGRPNQPADREAKGSVRGHTAKHVALMLPTILLALGCRHVESGVDPEPLGYGPGPHISLASGYESDPAPRPAPTPWTPPAHDGSDRIANLGELVAEPTAEPIPHTADVLRVCDRRAKLGEAVGEREACLRRYRIARVFRSIGDWKTLVSCTDASPDRVAIDACERTTPPAFELPAEYPRESAVCLHLFALLILEEMGAEPMLATEDFAEFEPLVRECVDGLVGETRKDRNPTEYVEVLDCIERAQTSPAAEACESAPASQVRDMNQ